MRRLVLLGLVLGLSLSACSSSGDKAPESSPHPDDPTIARYVALGDSLTSGPGIEPMSKKEPKCERSTANYPALIARRLKATLTDVSCGSATTLDVLTTPQTKAGVTRPQIEAVTSDADLVTISIGANNGYATPMFLNCIFAETPGQTCEKFADDKLPTLLPEIETAVRATLEEIVRRAPDATVVLVGYLAYAPGGQGCPAMPLRSTTLDRIDAAERELETVLVSAAKNSGAVFVPMGRLSAKHGPCAKKPWVNGAKSSRDDGAWLHPTRGGMAAIADAVVKATRDARSDSQG